MGCKFPEHHGSASFTGEGGSGGGVPWPLLIAVAAVALLAPVIAAIIHAITAVASVIIGVLVFIGIATLAILAGKAWRWVTSRPLRQIPVRYQPQMTAPRWRPGLPQEQQQAVQAGPHLTINLGGASPETATAAIREIRGGR